MKLEIAKQTVWSAAIGDEPGGLASKLRPLADAGVDLEFMIARRSSESRGTAVVFLTPITGSKQVRAAKAAGFQKAESLHGLRVEGRNQPGLGAMITEAVAAANINMRGFSAAVIGQRYVMNLSFDSESDCNKARRALAALS
jgi:hypothetical protein